MAIVRLALTVLLLFPVTPLLRAQSDPVWGRLSNAIKVLREIPGSPDNRGRLGDLAGRMDKDFAIIFTATKGDVHMTFRESLELDAEALEGVRRQETPINRVLIICGGVANDLGVKAGYVVNAKGQSGPVAVETWTRKGDQNRHQYEVRYTPQAFPDRQPKSFNGVSSPTREPRIAPGAYFFWSFKDGTDGARKPVDIGADGRTAVTEVVQVPSSHP